MDLRACRCLMLLGLSLPALARADVPAYEQGILDRVGETYRTLQSVHLSGRIRVETIPSGGQDAFESPFVVAAARFGRTRDELTDPRSGMVQVSDGSQTWTYYPALEQYQHLPVSRPDILDPDAGGGAGMRISFGSALLANYRGVGMTVAAVRMRPVDYLPFDGGQRECYVLEVTYQGGDDTPVRSFWIDKERFVVLEHQVRTVESGAGARIERLETVVYDRVDLDQPVPDSLFAFSPPAGAKEVKRFGPEEVDLSGRIATDFSLPDLAGKIHALESYRGKVVMLDFWATWCGPCRIQMPAVDKLLTEFRSRGLVVFAVNERESAKSAGAFMRNSGYTTTTLLDAKGEVGNLYHVVGIPTLVVIDRKGKIVAHYVGVRPETELRAALGRAGLR